PAVVQRPHDEAEPLLIADLDVAVTTIHPLSGGREQLLDALLLCVRPDHACTVGFPQVLETSLKDPVDGGQIVFNGHLDADLLKMGEKLLPASVLADDDAPGPV